MEVLELQKQCKLWEGDEVMQIEHLPEMCKEAIGRMKLLGVREAHQNKFEETHMPIKLEVNNEERSLRVKALSAEEVKMIEKLQEEKNILIYYVIKDEGIWPDGIAFSRYSLLHIDTYLMDYDFVKESCIKCGTVPAYVINVDEPSCSELVEIGFANVDGVIVNIT